MAKSKLFGAFKNWARIIDAINEAKAAKEQLETATTGAKQLVAELKAATEQAEALKAEVATLKAAAQSSVE